MKSTKLAALALAGAVASGPALAELVIPTSATGPAPMPPAAFRSRMATRTISRCSMNVTGASAASRSA